MIAGSESGRRRTVGNRTTSAQANTERQPPNAASRGKPMGLGLSNGVTDRVGALRSPTIPSCMTQSDLVALQLLEAADECILAVDADWRIVYANEAALAQTRRGRDVIGTCLWAEFPGAKGTIIESSYRGALQARERVRFDVFFEPLDCWFDVNATPLSSGGLAIWFRNIDQRKEKEEALKLAEEKYRIAASAAADLVTEWDFATGEVTVSHSNRSTLGFNEDFVLDAESCAERVHPDDRERVRQEIEACLAGDDTVICQSRFMKPDGEYAEVEQRSILQRDSNGRAIRLISALRDVTSEKRANNEIKKREAQLSRIFGQALVGMMETGPDGRPRMVNQRFCEILGRTEAELKNLTLEDYTHPDDLAANRAVLDRSLKTADAFQLEKRYVRPDGSIVWCRVHVSFVPSEDDAIVSTIVVAEDITARREAELALRESETLYRSVLEASQDCIKILDTEGRIKYINPAGVRVMELGTPASVLGASWANLWPDTSKDLVQASVDAAAQGEVIRFTAKCPTACGTPRWWDVLASPIRSESGDVRQVLVISRDTTDQIERADQLRWTSEHDWLTELPNRRAFEAHLQAAILRAMQAESQVGLLLIDLDHFKHVNDTLGHAAGDQLLSVLSARLREAVRSGDFVARLGGDEFAIILESKARDLDLLPTGEAILKRLQVPVRFQERMVSASASIGGAVFPHDASNANDLLKNADIALYALKQSGRGGTRIFQQHMREKAQLVASQLGLARSMLSKEAIVPHYQPKVLLKTGRIVGFEALLRWSHVTRGIQLPDTVSEAFKHYDLASRIGALMQSQVFGDLRRWLDGGVPVGVVAINAAPAEFLRDDFAERFLERVQQEAVPPSLIEVEITEQVFLEQGSDYVARALQVLKAAGVRLALDDFGTGYSSLSHLRDFPVDVVKIDQSFVTKMTSDPEVKAIVSAVVQLAKSLKIEVVAEGVETREQRIALVQEGCALGQGFLFGRAAAGDEIPAILRTAELNWRRVA
jgi:diguanylate cyclase (GGDEF)-like protein/PAS domain S-box-containing protein